MCGCPSDAALPARPLHLSPGDGLDLDGPGGMGYKRRSGDSPRWLSPAGPGLCGVTRAFSLPRVPSRAPRPQKRGSQTDRQGRRR